MRKIIALIFWTLVLVIFGVKAARQVIALYCNFTSNDMTKMTNWEIIKRVFWGIVDGTLCALSAKKMWSIVADLLATT